MKTLHFVICAAALALAACGQSTEAPAEPPAPASLFGQIQAMPAETQMVTAYQHLLAYQQAHPDVQPACQHVRATESRGIIPANVAPDSIYAAHVGSAVFSVQCGELRTLAPMDPREHWLVIYAPDATEAAVVSCLGADRRDQCPREVPTAEAPATP